MDLCIDAAAIIAIKNVFNCDKRVYYIDSVTAQILFSGNYKDNFRPLCQVNNNIKYVFIPYNEKQSHWALIVLDVPNKIINILNPSRMIALQTQMIFEKIRDFLIRVDRLSYNAEKMNYRKWELITDQNCPQQNDFENCGVYVIYYICLLCKNTETNQNETIFDMYENFDPETFRIVIQNMLLNGSENMINKCIKCGDKDFKHDIFVQCSDCNRWIHRSCANIESSLNISKISSDNYIFSCKYCEYYLSKSQEKNYNIDFKNEIEQDILKKCSK